MKSYVIDEFPSLPLQNVKRIFLPCITNTPTTTLNSASKTLKYYSNDAILYSKDDILNLSSDEDECNNKEEIRTIRLPALTTDNINTHENNKKIHKKKKNKRVVTKTDKWIFTEDELKHSNQCMLLLSIMENKDTKETTEQFITSQIKQKLRGYKEQDLNKNRYHETDFITLSGVLQKLKDCNLMCYYCKCPVSILYEYVREPTQWTIERINNIMGHNYDNVEIACLSCNIRRKTMYFERYLMTKQLCQNFVKK